METNKQITLAEFRSAKEEVMQPERLEALAKKGSSDNSVDFRFMMLALVIGMKILNDVEKILFPENQDLN